MRIVGLTGSIACGKSTVSNFLTRRGFPVVDGDRISRDLTVPGSPAVEQIRRVFGEDALYSDGSLNRRYIGRIVFSDPEARRKLDDIMAPFLLESTRRQIEAAHASGASLCFLDMPLLFEKGYDKFCDSVWTVWLPEDVQLSRLMKRDGYTSEEAMNRIRSVLSSDTKAARSDYVIDNSGTIERTYEMVSELIGAELQAAQAQSRPRRSHSAGTPSGYAPQAVPTPSSAPEVMARPAASSVRKAPRKSSWAMPVWLKTLLIVFTVLVSACIPALLLMNGYLYDCRVRHEEEENSIRNWYHESDLPLYLPWIEQYAQEYNLAPAYVTAIIRNESSFNPKAQSGAGARGLMQLMQDTAEWIARKLSVSGYAFERMLDPESNIRFGCWYLNYLSRLFNGDAVAVTAAYHAGQGQVKVWLSDPLISEDGYSLPLSSLPDGPTKNYAGRVTRDYGIYQKRYFSPDQLPADPGAADPGV